jgi:hypothetical protein
MQWNGVSSKQFPIKIGVKQGGILSPVLFAVYVDGLLNRRSNAEVGRYAGSKCLSALAYADDFVISNIVCYEAILCHWRYCARFFPRRESQTKEKQLNNK